MRFTETPVKGAFIIEPEPRADERGFFARLWCQRELADNGLNSMFVQSSVAFNHHRGTVRGLHYQVAPHREVKLVRCVRGAVFDVLVDLRRESPTYLQWFGANLTADNRTMLYVPEGCAHGYQTLDDDSELVYSVSQFYHPEAERGARWNDPIFRIQWPSCGPRTISAKDQSWPDYAP